MLPTEKASKSGLVSGLFTRPTQTAPKPAAPVLPSLSTLAVTGTAGTDSNFPVGRIPELIQAAASIGVQFLELHVAVTDAPAALAAAQASEHCKKVAVTGSTATEICFVGLTPEQVLEKLPVRSSFGIARILLTL
eukprot:gnl/Ergobibamus_cyprinoides/1578.p1 GENE.gnl/Ergobibamus_cyprinoides/1578~~gnl/Ergobibamus_cyprinoides/1578.p1  ORF type:complete len:135 (+),score=20.96 gnl/Ergobibamus_cyprinoides/1578:205-609(+)